MNYSIHYTGKFYKGLTLDMKSPSHSTKITYEVGKTYTSSDFEVSDQTCAPGIHFVTSIALALKWGPVVIEVEVPEGSEIVLGPDKSRAKEVKVLRVVDLHGADLHDAYLRGANLGGANLGGADLHDAYLPDGWEYKDGKVVRK